MEINQKLFDECTQNYKLQRQKEKEFVSKRDSVWMKIEELASSNPYYSKLARASEEYYYNSSVGAGGDDGGDEVIPYDHFEAPVQEVINIVSNNRAFLRTRSK